MRILIGIVVCCALAACGKKTQSAVPAKERQMEVRTVGEQKFLRIPNADGTSTLVREDAVAGEVQNFIVCDRDNKCRPKQGRLEGPCPGPECTIVKCDCKLGSCARVCEPGPPDSEVMTLFKPLP
jgi:hypothetical protein